MENFHNKSDSQVLVKQKPVVFHSKRVELILWYQNKLSTLPYFSKEIN